MSNINIENIMNIYLKLIDFSNNNYINLIKFKSTDLIQHVIDNSILKNDIGNDIENDIGNDIENDIGNDIEYDF
jgi:hypothetical protein